MGKLDDEFFGSLRKTHIRIAERKASTPHMYYERKQEILFQ
jgi:hypothetical protein